VANNEGDFIVRILMLSWEYPPNVVGGLGKHVAELTPALSRAGGEVHVVTPHGAEPPPGSRCPDEEVTEAGVRVYRVPRKGPEGDIYQQASETNNAMLTRVHALIADGHQYDIIHAHDWLVVFAAYALKHELRVPLVATIHATERGRTRGGPLTTELQRKIHGAEWWLIYEAWRVIVCSHHMASEVQAFFHVPAAKIDVVPNGVRPYPNGRWSAAELATCRARYGATNGPLVFAIGRLVYEKGFHRLIEATPHILSEFPQARFVIAGQGPEGPNLKQQARALGVADCVRFPGFISDEERDCLYHTAACAVFPSLYEPFGIVALEAMAAGCPVVVTEVGGLREVVHHGKTGVTIYPDDAQSVAWGVAHVLRNPELAAARAEEARRMACHHFSWDAVASRTMAIYRRVLDERQRVTW